MKKVKNYIKENKVLILSILAMAMPAIIEMSLNTLVGMADTIMISRLISPGALSAVGYANQILFMLIFIFTSFNTGSTAMIARSYGEQDFEKLNKIAGQNLTLNTILGVTITTVSLIFAEDIFKIYDMAPEVMQMSLDYFRIVGVGLIFMFLSFSFAAILRGAGDTKTPMTVTAIVNILNIIGNFVLITGFGPFPKMGVSGAALSTTISRFLGVMLYIYVTGFNHKIVKVRFKNFKLTSSVLKPLWKLSLPGAMEQTLMQVAFLIQGIMISTLDTSSEAAFRILLNIESISFMPAVGLSIASATLVGKALGEKDIEKATHTGYAASGLGITWGIIMGSIFFLFPEFLLKIYTPDKEIIALSIFTMYVAGLNQPFLNFTISMSGALRGAGDTFAVMIITIVRLWVVFVPLTALFILVLNYGVAGVWIGEIISLFIFSVVMFKRFQSKKWADIKI